MSDPRWLRSQSLVISSDKTLAARGRTTRRFRCDAVLCGRQIFRATTMHVGLVKSQSRAS
jgi:hypothetical protein